MKKRSVVSESLKWDKNKRSKLKGSLGPGESRLIHDAPSIVILTVSRCATITEDDSRI